VKKAAWNSNRLPSFPKANLNIYRYRVYVFIDDGNVLASEAWADAIQNKLRDADVLILIGTPDSFQSDYIRSELEFFCRRRDPRIFPIIFRDIIVSHVPPILHGFHWLQEDASALIDRPSPRTVRELLAALDYYQESVSSFPRPKPPRPQRKGQTGPLNEGKLILVGRGEVGKTSLVRRLVDNEFRGDESKTSYCQELCMEGSRGVLFNT
jgi:TIR domain-containing protein/DAPkinase-like Roc (Ras of Complex) protein